MEKRCVLAATLSVYWAGQWALAGVDTFLTDQALGPVRWIGSDREQAVALYLDRLGLDELPAAELTMAMGVLRLLLVLPFLVAAPRLLSRARGRYLSGLRLLEVGLAASLVILAVLGAAELVAGETAQLPARSVQVLIVAVSYLVGRFEVVAGDVLHHIRASGPESTQPHPMVRALPGDHERYDNQELESAWSS